MLDVRRDEKRGALTLLLCFLLFGFGPQETSAVEPGFRLHVSPGILKLNGRVGDNVKLGGGGSIEVAYRLYENFSLGVRWMAQYRLGASSTTIDGVDWDNVSMSGVLISSRLVFNPEETTRPMGVVGMGISWLRWEYAEPFYPPEDPAFSLDSDRLTATSFLLGGGVETDLGPHWEFCPAVYLLLNSWMDHTYEGREPYLDDEGERPIAPRDASFLLEIALGRRF